MLFIAGATGFIGSNLMAALAERGLRARCLLRSPEKVCPPGFEAARGDITDRESLRGRLEGVRTVVHLVGIMEEKGGRTFERVHVDGTRNLVDEAKRAGAGHFFYQSALGADINSWSRYLKTKAGAENIVRESGIPFTIFRPSLVIGAGDGFTRKLMDIIKSPAPFIPVPGKGRAKFQPLYVGDWVRCFLGIIDNPEALGKTYELGGPEHLTYNEIVRALAFHMGVRKRLLHIPLGIARFGARVLEKTRFGPATREQLGLLDSDNICETDGVRRDFGFDPVPFGEALRLAYHFTTSTGQEA